MVNFGPLTAEISLGVWGTPANFNWFRVLPLLLQRRRSPVANQTLHDVWPSPGLVHYIYIFWGFWHLRELCQVQTSLCVQVLRSPILVALLHGTRVVGVSQTSRHWAEGWPSRALAHILVALWIANFVCIKQCTRSLPLSELHIDFIKIINLWNKLLT